MTGSLAPRLLAGPLTGAALFVALAGGRIRRPRAGPVHVLLVRLLGFGASAALEELVWRALVLGSLVAAIGPAEGLAVSSIGFALWHRPALGSRCAVHLVTGVGFGAAFLIGGIAAAVLAHWSYNVLVDMAVVAERQRLRGP